MNVFAIVFFGLSMTSLVLNEMGKCPLKLADPVVCPLLLSVCSSVFVFDLITIIGDAVISRFNLPELLCTPCCIGLLLSYITLPFLLVFLGTQTIARLKK